MSRYGFFTGGSMSKVMGSVSRMAMLAAGVFSAPGGMAFPFTSDAVFDYDFANSRYYGPALSITRASTGWAEDNNGNWTEFAANTLRRTNRGVLIEEGRTNSVRTSNMDAATAGSPGSFPATMAASAPTGLVRTITKGSTNGVPWIDVNYSGTATSTAQVLIYFDLSIAAAQNQAWALSAFVSLSKTDPAVTALLTGLVERNAALSQTAVTQIAVPNVTTHERKFTSRTLTQADTNNLFGYIATASITSGTTVNFTIRLGQPQQELGQTSTSIIVTNGTAATRAADVIASTLTSALTNACTIIAILRPGAIITTVNQLITTIGEPGFANYIRLGRSTAAQMYVQAVTPGSALTPIHATVKPTDVRLATVAAFASADRVLTSDGLEPIYNTAAGAFPTGMVNVYVGNNGVGSAFMNGYLERFALRQARPPNNDIIELSKLANWA